MTWNRSQPRDAMPLSSIQLDCGHWINQKHVSDIGSTCYCVRCQCSRIVIAVTSYRAWCNQCGWTKELPSKYKILRQARKHAEINRHCTQTLGNSLDMEIFDETAGLDRLWRVD